MKYIYNKYFLSLIGPRLSSINERIDLPKGLVEILNSKIKIVHNCYYFEHVKVGGKCSLEFIDKTGNECFYNKIQIDEYCSEDVDKLNLMEIGICFSIKLSQKLIYSSFNIILSYDGEYCNVRFHKLRKKESWLNQDLDTYLDEAILLIKTN